MTATLIIELLVDDGEPEPEPTSLTSTGREAVEAARRFEEAFPRPDAPESPSHPPQKPSC